jgi:hypothetical protein
MITQNCQSIVIKWLQVKTGLGASMVDFEKFFNIEIENYRSENYFFELETGFDNIGF